MDIVCNKRCAKVKQCSELVAIYQYVNFEKFSDFVTLFLTVDFHTHTEYTGPFLHIDKEPKIGDDFLPELMITSREANSASMIKSVTTVNAVVFILFYLLSS